MKHKAPIVVIVAAALIPRLLHLNAFLTLDEFLWLDRSRNFLLALLGHDWATTFQTGHPGVTTMWIGGLGLWWYGLGQGLVQNGNFIPFLQYLDWNHQPLDLLPYLRLPTVFITTLGIVGVYYLLCALFDQRLALAGGLLLALDPWYLAHSRVLHHDVLMTTFMTLSALALLLYVWRGPTRWPLLFSGVCAGLALLSKTLGLFLFPWTALLFIIALWHRHWPLLQIVIDGAVWSLTAWLTFFLSWPAMWLKPTGTLWRMRQMIETYTINPHERAQFFLGQTIADPGPLFYPVVALFALTPLVVVGLTAIGWSGASKANFRPLNSRWGAVILLLVYVVAYTAFISLGEKKQDRYLLPAVAMLNVVAAVGLVWLGDDLAQVVSRRTQPVDRALPVTSTVLPLAILLVQALTTLPHHPYYLTYYNPLLGGNKIAARCLLVGWGEGSELAAQYLNSLPRAEELIVVASTPFIFAPFFRGKTLLGWPDAQMLAADYLVLYRRQLQQGQPDPHVLRYIGQNWPLETTIQLRGLDYAWIYRAPAADWTASMKDERGMIGRTGLMGYRLNQKTISSGQTLAVTLYRRHWPTLDGRWLVQLQGAGGQWEANPWPDAEGNKQSEPGEIVEDTYVLFINKQIHPGTYQVIIGLQREEGTDVQWLTQNDLPPMYVHISQKQSQ